MSTFVFDDNTDGLIKALVKTAFAYNSYGTSTIFYALTAQPCIAIKQNDLVGKSNLFHILINTVYRRPKMPKKKTVRLMQKR